MVMDLQNTNKRPLDEYEKIELINKREKDYFIEQVCMFNSETEMINTIHGNIEDVFHVFILSDDFNQLDTKNKRKVLKSFDSLKRLLMNVEVFCMENKLGQYTLDN